MLRACVDIGSNTTRLLVAECRDGTLEEVCQQRAFTRLGKLGRDGRVGPKKIAELAEVVRAQVHTARQLGAESVRAVGTAALRQAGDRDAVLGAVRAAADVEVEILSGGEEARLAFVGATRTLGHAPVGEVGVVDVGGGSSELIVGTLASGVCWCESFRLGSGDLAEAYLRSDPPSVEELNAVRAHVAGALEGVQAPQPVHALAVGGSATSLRRLVGAVLEPETLERGLRVLATERTEDVARRFELDARRVRLLPAGILILEAASELFGRALQVSRGGLREGVLLEAGAAA
ncbi:MAG: exopolyphosphatase / guanosine-5-triphosphate,3-diphosphate pyrophosphatase [Solirubrobacteraceae bacterium]|nr:exopolyphosphatase / guanosine-5-triphosphate,3-diphosphate pyrophosphatase [Solirubrobacteraceae bacterium]